MFGLQQKQVLGLDIGSSDIKAVVINTDSSVPVFTDAAVIDLKCDPDAPSSQKQAEISNAIKDFLLIHNLSPSGIICGLSGPEVIVRGFKFPHLSQSEIASAVKLEAEQIFPFASNETTVDYKLLPTNGETVCGVLAAATNKLVNAKHLLVSDISQSSLKIGIDGLAMLNCLDIKNAAVLNIGNSYATFAAFDPNGIPLVRDLPFGYDRLINHFADDAGISFQIARGKLFNNKTSAACDKPIKELMVKMYAKLADDITRTVFYYKSQKKAVIDTVLVCGRLSQMPEFIDALNNSLSEEVVRWNPLEKSVAETKCKQLLAGDGSVFAVAAGLALKPAKETLSLDLLKGHGLLARAGIGGIAVAITAIAIPLVIAMLMVAVYQTRSIELSMLQQRKVDFKKKVSGLSDQIGLQKKLELEKKSHQSILMEVNDSINKHTQWSPVIEEIVKNLPDSMLLTRLEIRQDSVSKTVPNEKDAQLRTMRVPVKTVRLNIRANQNINNDEHVREFIAKLYSSEPLRAKLDDTKISQDVDALSKYNFVSYNIDLIMKPEL